MINRLEENRIAILEIAHGKVGAMDLELLEDLDRALGEISGAPALVLTGKGRAFSAGVDLFRIIQDGEGYIRAFLAALHRMLESLHRFPRPVIAAINGHAIAGGCVLAAAADERFMAAQSGLIGIPELKVGVPFPALALETMRMALAPPTFQDWVYSGRLLKPEEALDLQFLNGVVPPEDLRTVCLERAQDLASLPAQSFSLTKEAIRRPYLSEARRTDSMRDRILNQWCRPEVHEFIAAYLEKTVGSKSK